MSRCLDDGALRAYLDGELEMRAAAHLEACPICCGRLARLEATAKRVDEWLEMLEPEAPPAYCAIPSIPRAVLTARHRWAALAAGAASIAALAAVFVTARPRESTTTSLSKPEVAALPPVAAEQPARPVPKPRLARTRHGQRHSALPHLDEFMALDDSDPIQIGLVVRVMVPVSEPGWAPQQQLPADLVIGEDGRARAIRFVSGQ